MSPSPVQVAAPSPRQPALQSGRSELTSGSVPVPDLGPLLERVTGVLSEVERQRSQLTAQERLLQEYRSRTGRGGGPAAQRTDRGQVGSTGVSSLAEQPQGRRQLLKFSCVVENVRNECN